MENIIRNVFNQFQANDSEVLENKVSDDQDDNSSIASDWSIIDPDDSSTTQQSVEHASELPMSDDPSSMVAETQESMRTDLVPNLSHPTIPIRPTAISVDVETEPPNVLQPEIAQDGSQMASPRTGRLQRHQKAGSTGNSRPGNNGTNSKAAMARVNRAVTSARLAKPKIVKQLHRGAMLSTGFQRPSGHRGGGNTTS